MNLTTWRLWTRTGWDFYGENVLSEYKKGPSMHFLKHSGLWGPQFQEMTQSYFPFDFFQMMYTLHSTCLHEMFRTFYSINYGFM